MSCAVSVVLPVRGDEYDAIARAIDSILSQTFQDLELLIINDDPENSELSKCLQHYIEGFADRVRILDGKGKGIARALNMAIAEAKGEFVARMDADDIAEPARLEKQYHYLRAHPEVGIVGMQSVYIDAAGNTLGQSSKPLSYRQIVDYACFANPLVHPTWFVRKQVYEYLGAYKDMSPAQDYHFLVKALKAGIVINNLPEIGVRYTIREKSASRKNIYLTLRLASLIRESCRFKLNNDLQIDRMLAEQGEHVCFARLYGWRTQCLDWATASDSAAVAFMYQLLAGFVSALHPLLLKDSLAGYRARKIASRREQ